MTNKIPITSSEPSTLMLHSNVSTARATISSHEQSIGNKLGNSSRETYLYGRIMHKPLISYSPPIVERSSPLNVNRPETPSTSFDGLSLQHSATDSISSPPSSSDIIPSLRLTPPPPVSYFRRPSFPLYYPSQYYSSSIHKKSPYKRPRSNPLYLPTDKEYYPSIAQSYRRRRSTTPPFKDFKQNILKSVSSLHHPPSIKEIWSIPREVRMP